MRQIIYYLIIIAVILVAVVLSQQAFSRVNEVSFISDAVNQARAFFAKGAEWTKGTLSEKVSGAGEVIQSEIENKKEKISENILEKAENYFSGIIDSVLHPNTRQNCQPESTQSSSETQLIDVLSN